MPHWHLQDQQKRGHFDLESDVAFLAPWLQGLSLVSLKAYKAEGFRPKRSTGFSGVGVRLTALAFGREQALRSSSNLPGCPGKELGLGPKYYNMNGIWALKPYSLGPWRDKMLPCSLCRHVG